MLIDSLGADFFLDAEYNKGMNDDEAQEFKISKEAYIAAYHEKLCNIIRKFDVTVVYTQSIQDRQIAGDKIPTHRIRLEKLNEAVYKMEIKSNGKEHQVWYTIDFYGIRIVEE